MAWVTWRQHRHQLLIGLALIVGLALAALITGLPMRTAYQREALSSCLPPTARSGCDIIVRHFQSEFGSRVDIARYLILLPALVGMFVGAPLLARELEQGTHRFAWTQSVTRRRWLLTKTLLLALAVTAERAGAERDRDVVAAAVRRPRGPHEPERLRDPGPGRARVCRVRSRSRCARRRRASAQPGGDIADAGCVRRRSARSGEAPAAALPVAASTRRWQGWSPAPMRVTGC